MLFFLPCTSLSSRVCVSPWLSSRAAHCGDSQLNSRFSNTNFSSVPVSLFLLLPVPFSLLAFCILIRLLIGISAFFLQLIIFPNFVLHENHLITSPSRLRKPTGDNGSTHLFRGGRNPPCLLIYKFIERPAFILKLSACLEVLLEQINNVLKDNGKPFKVKSCKRSWDLGLEQDFFTSHVFSIVSRDSPDRH